jgi:hypothetical protein
LPDDLRQDVLAQPKLPKQNFYSQNYFSENSKPAAPPFHQFLALHNFHHLPNRVHVYMYSLYEGID